MKSSINHTNEGYDGSLRTLMGTKVSPSLFLGASDIDEESVPAGWKIVVKKNSEKNFPNQKTFTVQRRGDSKSYGFKVFYGEGKFQISGFSPDKNINEYVEDGLIAYFNTWAEKNGFSERIVHNPDKIKMSTTNGQMKCGCKINVDSLRTFLARIEKFQLPKLQRRESVSRGLMVYIPFEPVCKEGITYGEFVRMLREKSKLGRNEEDSNEKPMSFRFSNNGTIHFYRLPGKPKRERDNGLRFIADMLDAFFEFSRN